MIDGLRPWSASLRVRLASTVALSLPRGTITPGGASAATLSAHGQLLHLAPGVRANANQSSNWFGYSQGSLEQGDTLFNSISGNWTVPTATQHTSGQAEASSDWFGIGG